MKNKDNIFIQHLKTYKKYNTLEIKYQAKCEDLDHKTIELNTERRIKAKQQELYNEKIQELTEQNIELKSKIAKLRKELRKCTKVKEK